MDKLTRQQKITIASILLVAASIKVVFLVVWFFNDRHTPDQNLVVKIPSCNIKAGCELPNGDEIQFIGTLNSKTPFSILYKSSKASERNVSVQFEMKNMDMGFNRYKLINSHNNTEQKEAQNVRLPVCTDHRMDYIATVKVDNQAYLIEFKGQH
ncbi:hypothetical protein [Neisseria sp. Ec49-e6-T10]|uniref:hypothetical protein n=1 Tax=Neisseria sp. Ec49-e6-T10 TaxID=3140744 RepID=UPI003EB7CA9C